MKQFFSLMIFYAFLNPAHAGTEPIAKNIKAAIVENNLLLTWNEANSSEKGSWEIQASADGKSFSTIGLVWGADPKVDNSSYAFKQKTNKVQSKYKYYRVIYIAETNATVASNAIELSK